MLGTSHLTGFNAAGVAGDVTAPVLSSATATTVSQTTASGSVSTDEGNGTLYWFVSTSGTPPTAANLKAGVGAVAFNNQPVSGAGVQNVASITGLTAETAYYIHYLHSDAAGNDSSIATTSSFLTWGDNLVVNGDFSSSAGWTTGTAWSIGSGVATHNNNADNIRRSASLVAGQTYRTRFTVLNYVGATVRVRLASSAALGGNVTDGTLRTANGTYEEDLVAPTSAAYLGLVGTSGGGANALQVDNLEVWRIA